MQSRRVFFVAQLEQILSPLLIPITFQGTSHRSPTNQLAFFEWIIIFIVSCRITFKVNMVIINPGWLVSVFDLRRLYNYHKLPPISVGSDYSNLGMPSTESFAKCKITRFDQLKTADCLWLPWFVETFLFALKFKQKMSDAQNATKLRPLVVAGKGICVEEWEEWKKKHGLPLKQGCSRCVFLLYYYCNWCLHIYHD